MHMAGRRCRLQTAIYNYLCPIAVILLILGCDFTKAVAVPTELIGTWVTEDPRYKGLFFKIDHLSFSLSTVEGGVENYTIIKYEQANSTSPDSARTHILYGNRDGHNLQVKLIYDPVSGGRLTFKNQSKTFWIKSDSSAP